MYSIFVCKSCKRFPGETKEETIYEYSLQQVRDLHGEAQTGDPLPTGNGSLILCYPDARYEGFFKVGQEYDLQLMK